MSEDLHKKLGGGLHRCGLHRKSNAFLGNLANFYEHPVNFFGSFVHVTGSPGNALEIYPGKP